MKVTLDGIKAKIKGETYLVLPDGKSTLCILDLENGYTIKGLSACVDPAEFDRDLGRKYAFEDAIKQIWPLEGYLLAQRMHEEKAKASEPLVVAVKDAQKAFDKEYKTWTAKPAGRRIIAKRVDAPWGLKKDGTPKAKPGGPRK